jgi:probable rRNA maturation factor
MPVHEPLVLMRRASSGLRRGRLEEFACELRRRVTGGREFQCLLTGDAEMRRLNREFRRKDYPTDVLSFPAGPCAHKRKAQAGTPDLPSLGDIAISLDRARAQAREFGHAVDDEICILMLHGVLHLLGMDHERDAGVMARAETEWRRQLRLPSALIERVSA